VICPACRGVCTLWRRLLVVDVVRIQGVPDGAVDEREAVVVGKRVTEIVVARCPGCGGSYVQSIAPRGPVLP
jgi:hypothetical protein